MSSRQAIRKLKMQSLNVRSRLASNFNCCLIRSIIYFNPIRLILASYVIKRFQDAKSMFILFLALKDPLNDRNLIWLRHWWARSWESSSNELLLMWQIVRITKWLNLDIHSRSLVSLPYVYWISRRL